MTAACAFILAATLSSTPADNRAGTEAASQPTTGPISAAVSATPAFEPAQEAWTIDRPVSRPPAMKALYGTLGALQALDIYSTRRAINRGGREVNPLLEQAAGSQAAMMAVKAISTASTIYFAERAWKKNRKGAIVLMAIVNGVTAAVAANNLRNAR